MAFTKISRQQFDSYKSFPYAEAASLIDEIECFASDCSALCGAVSLHQDDNDHSVVVLRPDEDGVYRAIEAEVSIGSIEVARERLFAAMTQLEQRPGSPAVSS